MGQTAFSEGRRSSIFWRYENLKGCGNIEYTRMPALCFICSKRPNSIFLEVIVYIKCACRHVEENKCALNVLRKVWSLWSKGSVNAYKSNMGNNS